MPSADSSSTRSRTSRLPTSSASSTVTVSRGARAVPERRGSGRRAGGQRAEKSEHSPPAHTLTVGSAGAGIGDGLARICEHLLEERSILGGERVRRLGHLPARERRVAQEVLDVAAAALHHLASEPATLCARSSVERSSGSSRNDGSRKPIRVRKASSLPEWGVAVTRRRWREACSARRLTSW